MMKDKVVIITGGAKGIGRGTAEVILEKGGRVVVADLERTDDMPKGVEFMECDVTSSASVDAMVRETARRFGRLDGLFANAGIGTYKDFLEMDDAFWRETLAVNLDGVFYCCRAAAREMKKRGGGAIVATSSVRALATTAVVAHYTSSKAGVLGLVTALANDLAPHGIRVNAVLPGAIETPMLWDAARLFTDNDMEKLKTTFLPMVPMKRIGQPREIGEAVAFLLSDAASYITGAHLPVDGGMLCQLC